VFKRIEDWVIRRLPSRRAARDATIQVSSEGFQIRTPSASRLVRWGEIDRVVATKAEQFVGSTFILVFGLHDGSALSITENDSAWHLATRIMPGELRGAKDFAAWGVALVAAVNGEVEVFRRQSPVTERRQS
jgi:hypothetical protein